MPGSATISWINNTVADITLFNTNTNVALGTTTSSTTINSVPANATMVVSMTNSDDSSGALTGSVNSTPSLTWTKQVDASAGSSGNAEIWTAPFAAGGNITVNTVWNAAMGQCTSCLYAFTNTETVLGGATAVETAETAPSTNLTTTRANSYVVGTISDWNAANGARTYRNSETELLYNFQSSVGTAYHFYKLVATAALNTFGVSAPASQASGVCYLEIRTP